MVYTSFKLLFQFRLWKASPLIIIAVFSINTVFCQDIPNRYFELVSKADSLYQINDYRNSSYTYTQAFKADAWLGLPNDRYKAACSWAQAGNADSAFYQLNKIIVYSRYSNYGEINADPDLEKLQTDNRWKPLLEKVKQNEFNEFKNLNKPLVNQLEIIYSEDQKSRQKIESIEKLYGKESSEAKALWRVIHDKDSINLKKVIAILDRYGWPGIETIGSQGSTTIFLVLQHADSKTQEKYLPLMRDAVKKGNANASNLALLEDRVALKQKGEQIYGSQIGYDSLKKEYFVFPISDPHNVDKRRVAVGLQPVADYVSYWQIHWDIVQNKPDLPKPWIAQNYLSINLFFQTNNYVLTIEEQSKLKRFVGQLDSFEIKNISIVAYCDDIGDTIFNSRLSKQRAQHLREILKSLKVDNKLITEVIGKGELPLSIENNNDTTSQRSNNRRVEITARFNQELHLGDKTTLENLLFIGGEHNLLPESYPYLDTLKQSLQQHPNYCIVILGHIACFQCYPPGVDAEDHQTGWNNLSEARAKIIYDYLINHGIDPKRLSYRGLKGDYPTGRGVKYDRRVEIKISRITK